jgi:hypothetical protein
MLTPVRATSFGYSILLTGGILAFVSAVVPFYEAGHRLDSGILLAGMLPYLVYGLPAVLLRGLLSVVSGLGVLALHTGTVVHARWLDGAASGGTLLYLVPLVLTAALVPLVVVALRRRGAISVQAGSDSPASTQSGAPVSRQ